MSYKPRFESGLWNVICDVCGRMYKSNELQMRWDNLMTCKGDWEPRQPQDFVRGVADKQAVPFSRAEQSDYFLPICTPLTSQGIAGLAVSGCAIAGLDRGLRPET